MLLAKADESTYFDVSVPEHFPFAKTDKNKSKRLNLMRSNPNCHGNKTGHKQSL
jgi:D-alanyl-D-alanine carboxypeptidase